MGRFPPADVRRALRAEVGFGCPVPGCGTPFLEWHHFDPPWSEEEHHRPDGMVALCRLHHIQADNGAFTKEQLKEYKLNGKSNFAKVSAKFNWLRNEILVVVGGNYYYNSPYVFQVDDNAVIWFNRDTSGNFLLNFSMLSFSGLQRAAMFDNEMLLTGDEVDVEAPPSAKRIKVSYDNKDSVFLEFEEYKTDVDLIKAYPSVSPYVSELKFPVTTLELNMNVGGSSFSLSARKTTLGPFSIEGNFMKEGGLRIDSSYINCCKK
ncbi:HNH endonuclease signature motif containing protein [Klebsiella pneumoniae]|uniref:HNH endonuclease signature motif containing protein n=1 Tax=Klebsiella pneumoniae TaxID=573 RepID=UPI000808BCA9|nr:HNH endonuclease signature motif containing protein [Klebsiella pneumoniae]SBZ14138.1 Uncharacterised protein [Klebsiella pneumoniae]VTT38640.1 Uncharacterised protein [Klebsiella pneumoniae]